MSTGEKPPWGVTAMDAIDAEDFKRISGYLEKMPTAMRRAATLRKVYGLSQVEIADRLNLPMQEVEHLLAEAVRFCADRLDDVELH